MGTESYVLRWNEFHSNLATSFSDLRSDEDFMDVSVVCNEGDPSGVRAHRVVLASSSDFFRGVLKRNPSWQNPVLVMPPNTRFSDLRSMIDFMYHGEVSIPNEDLESFLSLAHLLKVKGLTEDKPAPEPVKPQYKAPPPPKRPQPPSPRLPAGIQMVRNQPEPKRPRMQPKASPMKDYGNEDIDAEDDIHEVPQGEEDSNDYFGDEYDEFGNYAAIPPAPTQQPAYQPPQPSGSGAAPTPPGPVLKGLLCPNCRQMCTSVAELKAHIAAVHGGPADDHPPRGQGRTPKAQAEPTGEEIACEYCDKTFKQHKYMVAHLKRIHKVGGRGSATSAAASRQDGGMGSSGGPPSHQQLKRRPGRPPKNMAPADMDDPLQSPEHHPKEPRPIGAVHPAPRGHPQSTSTGDGPPPVRQGPHPGPRGPHRGSRPEHEQMRKGSPMGRGGLQLPKPDLKKLGLKFGGQISITSSDQGPSRRSETGHGVSIMKLKGDMPIGSPVSMKDVTQRPGGRTPQQQPSTSSGPAQQHQVSQSQPSENLPVEVKQEPVEQYEGDEENEELQQDFDEGQFEDEYGDGAYGDPANVSASVDGMYGAEGYDENVEDQDMEDDEYSGGGGRGGYQEEGYEDDMPEDGMQQ